MKDEEMAEEYAEEHSFRVPYDGSNKFYDDTDFKASKDGFLAGLKASVQWHDLRKDPSDLPKATTPVLVILESGVPYVSWISSDKGWWFCTNYYTGEDKVIAWCEIPTFDME